MDPEQAAPDNTLPQTNQSGSLNEAADRMRALTQPEPTEPPDTVDTESTPPDTESSVDETSEPETIDQDDQDDQELTPDDTGATDDADNELELDAEQFADLLKLEHSQLIVDDNNEISFKTKVDGIEGKATLKELIKSYQNEATLTNRTMQATDLVKQRQDVLQQANDAAQQQAQFSATLLESMNNEYLADLQSADMDQLRIDDPAEFSAKQIEMQQRRQKIQDMATQSLNVLQQQQANQNAEQQRLYNDRIPIEAQALKDAFKPMKVEVNATLQTDITNYLSGQHFSNDEIANMLDHRLMMMAYKAKQFDQGMKRATDKTLKKKLPKVLKSGKKASRTAVATEQAMKLRAKAKQSGSIEDAVARMRSLK